MNQMKRKMMTMKVMRCLLVAMAALVVGVVSSVAQSVVPDATTPVAPAAVPTPAGPATDSNAKDASVKTSGPELRDRYPRYKIEAGDQFDVTFDLSPEFNQTVTVQPDGYVTMRGVGDLHVQGQTVPELTQTLRTVYGKILNAPIIAVVLKDFEKPYFIADGQVGKPGKYELRGDMTLTEAIAMAGGFQDSAKHSQVLLFRKFNDQWTEAKMFNVKKMEKDGNLKEDPFLHPGDMLFVPKNAFSKLKPFIPNGSVGTFLSPIK
jgi:protein involved in polysaccharide export with SLBB domain